MSSSSNHSDEPAAMSLGDHLEALRSRLIKALLGLLVAWVACLFFASFFIKVLEYPYLKAMKDFGREPQLLALKAQAGLLMYLKVALWGGVVLSSPWIIYQIWAFIAEGLYEKEKRFVRRVVPLAAGLFIGGAMFYLFVVSVPMMKFFIAVNDRLGLQTQLTLVNQVNMTLTMMLVFAVSFQVPIVVAGLGYVNLISSKTLSRFRRHVIVGMLIFAALVTSPSPVDQILLALPMWFLFELGVFMVKMLEKKRLEEENSHQVNP